MHGSIMAAVIPRTREYMYHVHERQPTKVEIMQYEYEMLALTNILTCHGNFVIHYDDFNQIMTMYLCGL